MYIGVRDILTEYYRDILSWSFLFP